MAVTTKDLNMRYLDNMYDAIGNAIIWGNIVGPSKDYHLDIDWHWPDKYKTETTTGERPMQYVVKIVYSDGSFNYLKAEGTPMDRYTRVLNYAELHDDQVDAMRTAIDYFNESVVGSSCTVDVVPVRTHTVVEEV